MRHNYGWVIREDFVEESIFELYICMFVYVCMYVVVKKVVMRQNRQNKGRIAFRKKEYRYLRELSSMGWWIWRYLIKVIKDILEFENWWFIRYWLPRSSVTVLFSSSHYNYVPYIFCLLNFWKSPNITFYNVQSVILRLKHWERL